MAERLVGEGPLKDGPQAALAAGRQALYRKMAALEAAWASGAAEPQAVRELVAILSDAPDPLLRAQVGACLGRVLPAVEGELRRTVAEALLSLTRDSASIVRRTGLDACSTLFGDETLRYVAADRLLALARPDDEFCADRHLSALRRAAEGLGDRRAFALLEESARSLDGRISGLGHFHLALLAVARIADPTAAPDADGLEQALSHLRFAQERAGPDDRARFLEAILRLLSGSLSGSGPPDAGARAGEARRALASMLQDSFGPTATARECEALHAVLSAAQRLLEMATAFDALPGSDQFGADFAAALALASAIVDGAERGSRREAPGAAEASRAGDAVAKSVLWILVPRHAARLHERNPWAKEQIRRALARSGAAASLPATLLAPFVKPADPGTERERIRADLLARIDASRDPGLADLRSRVDALDPLHLTVEELAAAERELFFRPRNSLAVPTRTYLGGFPNAEQSVRAILGELDAAAPGYEPERRELFQHLLAILVNYLYVSWKDPRPLHLREQDEVWEPRMLRKLPGLGAQVPETVFQADVFSHLLRSDLGYFVTREDPDAGSRIDFQARLPAVTYPIEVKVAGQAPVRPRVRSDYLPQAQGYTVAHDQIGFQVILDVSAKERDAIEPNLLECVWWDTATREGAERAGGLAVLVCYGNRWKRQSDRSKYR